MTTEQKPHFDVHPSVVYQLGESLITDSVQALIELVKNSYDADATYAKVTADTQGRVEIPGAMYSGDAGRIIVEDDGNGMTGDELTTGWLLISNRQKLELKREKRTTPGGRTPLGDKGLGRLGVQRLGENLEIFTRAAKHEGQHMAFSWLDFATAPTLRDVDVHLSEFPYDRPQGTRVVVSGLRDVDAWRGQAAIKQLEQELSQMISPYKEIREFTVFVEIDGKRLDLVEISEKVRDLAPVRYRIDFDGNTVSIRGRVRLDFFRPNNPTDAELFALIAESDGGSSFFDFLSQSKVAKTLNLKRSTSVRWFAEFGQSKQLADFDKLALDGETPANPGPFHAEIDSFDFGQIAFKQQRVFDRLDDYRQYIKDLGGIRVFRDGFAVRVDRDWLKLGAQWTGARSYYGLKPENTHGFVALSARDNIKLEETTDREGFSDTPHYRNFYALLTWFKDFTVSAHNFLGRSWSEFGKKRNEQLAHVDSRRTVEDISRTIKQGLADAATHQKNLKAFHTRLDLGIKESHSVAARLASATSVTPQLQEKITQALSSLEPLLNEAMNVTAQVSEYMARINALEGMGQVLEDRVNSLRRQMDDMYETVALGLTAEALSHEVFNVADQLAARVKSAQTRVRNMGLTDRTVLAFFEHVNSAAMALRKQMSFLSPALRYVREKRESFDIAAFLAEQCDFYRDRLAKSDVGITIDRTTSEPIVIRMNRGKLSQIFYNFVLNSEYWLKEDVAKKRIDNGRIAFELDHPFVRISDNGRGIDPTVEHALFEPFVSAKAQGRGLGLFIVKQLLDSEGCSVGVVPERNRHHRLYKFQIDFRGAIDD
jgi:signal transduction histidine kinase